MNIGREQKILYTVQTAHCAMAMDEHLWDTLFVFLFSQEQPYDDTGSSDSQIRMNFRKKLQTASEPPTPPVSENYVALFTTKVFGFD